MAKKKAKRKTKAKTNRRRRKAGRRKSDQNQPGWVYLTAGLAIGLAFAVYIYLSDIPPPSELQTALEDTAEAAREAASELEAQVGEAAETVAESVEESADSPEFEYDFYNMLPSLDVEVYEDPAAPPTRRAAAPVQAPATNPGIYILQAGSFSSVEDASRRKAEMGLLGIRADIKRGDANNRTVYRVYTQTMDDPGEVNRVSKQLNQAGIEVLRKRVSD